MKNHIRSPERQILDGSSIIVRRFHEVDIPELLGLMRDLAVFEGYIDKFTVTESDIIERGLCSNPHFGAFVAVEKGSPHLLGMAVHYILPWTYDLKPTLVLKELYVRESSRGLGAGSKLMRAVASEAKRIGAPRISWTILAGNTSAIQFYTKLGGQQDSIWLPWGLDAGAIARLTVDQRK